MTKENKIIVLFIVFALIIIFGILFSKSASAQDDPLIWETGRDEVRMFDNYQYEAYLDSIFNEKVKICKERGHAFSYMTTNVKCLFNPDYNSLTSYIIDTDSTSILVKEYRCVRCAHIEKTKEIIWTKPFKGIKGQLLRVNVDSCNIEFITFKELLEYEKECVADTIKAIRYESEFIIDHGTYREMVSIEQLNKRGYIYAYRWVIDIDPFEFEYYFIKEPTLKDFILWLKQ